MREFSAVHPVWLCDVWGVLHDGVAPFASAVDALQRHRAAGGTVVLITNAPRLSDGVARQLAGLKVPPDCHDHIVTSGDVTRHLIAAHSGTGVFHLGPARDLGLFDGLDVTRVGLADATAVVCTGLFDDMRETPADYADRLARMRERDLETICANPDRVVRIGARLLYCAGALAEAYEKLGGKVLMAGKPYRPIYDLALELAAGTRGVPFAPDRVLAIGDGPDTDIAGAAAMGFAAVLIAGGIADASLSAAAVEAQTRSRVPGARIVKTMSQLSW